MDVQEIRSLKDKLQDDIAALLLDFLRKTELGLKDIEVARRIIHPANDKESKPQTVYQIRVIVEL
jgi:hypothetical protein